MAGSRKWPCLGCEKPLTVTEEMRHVCEVGWYVANGREHRQCTACRGWPIVDFPHYCATKGDMRVDISKKRWDHTIQAWVLDLPNPPAKFWDKETKSWVAETDFYASSCETPPEDWKKKKDKPDKGYYSGNTVASYRPCYPWEGVDRNKWPGTWWNLFFMYFQWDWHSLGHYITADDWEARLKGEYRPLPKWGRSNVQNNYMSYMNRGDYGEC